jgi:CDP-glycerol glycerophosphotransferase (TagB/SpsB family)
VRYLAKTDQLTLTNIVKLVLLNIVHWLSFLSIRDKTIWIFGSWDGKVFLDNPKYLFLASQKLSPSIKPIWISSNASLVKALRKSGYLAYYTWQIQAILYGFRAKYYFIDHAPLHGGSFFSPTNLWLSGGAKIIQLWHGVPLKRLDTVPSQEKSKTSEFLLALSGLSLFNLRVNYFLVVSSNSFTKIMSQAFQVPQKRIILSGYPRNIFPKIPEELNFSLQIETNNIVKQFKAQGKKLIFYIPTFRDYGGNPLTDAFNLERTKNFLANNESILVVKFHEVDKAILDDLGKDVLFLPSGFDIYEILDLCDILITDYSSIFFDFLNFNRPVIFYPYDFSDYQSARCFYFDYKEFVPGPIAYSFDELLQFLNRTLTGGTEDFSEKRKKLNSFCFEFTNVVWKAILVDY